MYIQLAILLLLLLVLAYIHIGPAPGASEKLKIGSPICKEPAFCSEYTSRDCEKISIRLLNICPSTCNTCGLNKEEKIKLRDFYLALKKDFMICDPAKCSDPSHALACRRTCQK